MDNYYTKNCGIEKMNSNKCPYLKKECKEPYNSERCYDHYETCWEYGRLKFIENYDKFKDTELMLGSLEEEVGKGNDS